jgi:hypothetical protein
MADRGHPPRQRRAALEGGREMEEVNFLFFLILQKYTTISKFRKTLLQPLYPMVVGTKCHGPRWLLIWTIYQLFEAQDDFK